MLTERVRCRVIRWFKRIGFLEAQAAAARVGKWTKDSPVNGTSGSVDGRPQRVIRREDPVIAMPVLPRRRDEIRKPIQELKRHALDDAAGPRLRGLS
jgi:hypothetical protein